MAALLRQKGVLRGFAILNSCIRKVGYRMAALLRQKGVLSGFAILNSCIRKVGYRMATPLRQKGVLRGEAPERGVGFPHPPSSPPWRGDRRKHFYLSASGLGKYISTILEFE
jgi:hypothetical protein